MLKIKIKSVDEIIVGAAKNFSTLSSKKM